jgi:hypothetical protein
VVGVAEFTLRVPRVRAATEEEAVEDYWLIMVLVVILILEAEVAAAQVMVDLQQGEQAAQV